MNSLKLTMGENTILRIDGDCRGAIISCEEGSVNVTQQNDSEDHILSNDGNFLINRQGRVIAWAHSAVSIEIVLPVINRYSVMERLRSFIAL